MSITPKSIKENTNFIIETWHTKGIEIASIQTRKILEQAKVEWLSSLTDDLIEYICLAEKGRKLSSGKLIIANTILGSLVESWLKYFYSVYYAAYEKEDSEINKKKKNGKTSLILPNLLSLERLKQFGNSHVWTENEFEDFFETVQKRRNIIHSFNTPKVTLGDEHDFLKLIKEYEKFLENLVVRLPDIEFDFVR
ncbi:MAG: hypothetical protein ACLR3E_01535 [Enterococcus durans]